MSNDGAPSGAGEVSGPGVEPRARRARFVNPVWIVTVVAVAAIAIMGLLFVSGFIGHSMVSGTSFSDPQLASASQISAWENQSNSSATAFSGNNTLWVHGGSPWMMIMMSPMGHDMTFVINGLVDPTIHVPLGTHLTVMISNMDLTMLHNWVLSNLAPPYSEDPMMDGGGMMGGSHEMWGSSMMGEPQRGMDWSQQLGFTLSTPGQFWYLCTYPSHASDGMYGSFVVG